MEQELRQVLVTSLAELDKKAGEQDVARVLLKVLEESSRLLEENIPVPSFNTPGAPNIRTLVFDIYNRLAKALGRNTPKAVKADTKVMISMIAGLIDHTPGFGRASKVSPQERITEVVMPFLDSDQKKFAHDMSVYHSPEKPSLMKFYRLLATRHSRSRHPPVR